MATGRIPETDNLGLDKIGVKMGKNQEILVDEDHLTNVENVYAIGDCLDKSNLTPVAIRAGRILGEHLYGSLKVKMDYTNIPTVIFS